MDSTVDASLVHVASSADGDGEIDSTVVASHSHVILWSLADDEVLEAEAELQDTLESDETRQPQDLACFCGPKPSWADLESLPADSDCELPSHSEAETESYKLLHCEPPSQFVAESDVDYPALRAAIPNRLDRWRKRNPNSSASVQFEHQASRENNKPARIQRALEAWGQIYAKSQRS